jgi:hypothetical protein
MDKVKGVRDQALPKGKGKRAKVKGMDQVLEGK